MQITNETKLRDIATHAPSATRVLDAHRLDYCCHGGRSLAEACAEASLDAGRLLAELEREARASADRGASTDWSGARAAELVDHILETHHAFTRSELSRLSTLADKVVARHGERHPELLEMRRVWTELRGDLEPHMMKEEHVLFPLIVQLERGGGPGPMPVEAPVDAMTSEHEHDGELLAELRRITSDYAPPGNACGSYRALYAGLEELERDLHQHIHLENNVLFPMARRLEPGS